MLRAKLRSWWRSVSRRSELERQMADEIQFHIDARADDLVARLGLPREHALRQARIEFGSVERYKEEGRESLGLRLADELRSDVRYGWRMLAANKGFAAAAIATLAIGIGANTAVFSVVDTVLLRTLPVRDPHELVMFEWLRTPDSMVASYSGYGRPGPSPGVQVRTSFSLPTFERFRSHSRTVGSLCAYTKVGPVSVVADGRAETAVGQVASGEYFSSLRVRPAVGRLLTTADDRPDAAAAAVISHRYWLRRFSADPAVVGKTFRVNQVPVTLVGVSEEGFHGTYIADTVDVTVPIAVAPAVRGEPSRMSSWWIEMMGRLNEGFTREQAAAELQGMFAETVRESWNARPPDTPNPSRHGIPTLHVVSGSHGGERTRRDAMPMLAILFAVVAAILLIGCVNLVNLLLVRASARSHELSVRLVLGARRGRIVRQLLTENLLLALGGALVGLIIARWAKDATMWLVVGSGDEAPPIEASLDLRVLAFTALLSIVSAVASGVGPAVRAIRRDLGEPMRVGPNRILGAHGHARRVLMAAQVALSLTLVIGAGLFARTLQNFIAVDLGFNADNLLVFRAAGTAEFYEDLVARIDAIPGVESATMSAMPLVANHQWSDAVVGDDPASRPEGVYIQIVRANFFETIQLPLQAGRGFETTDVEHAPHVAIVNETMARRIFGRPNPLGRHIRFTEWPERKGPFEVVGVARDAKYSSLETPAPPTLYLPYTQVPPRPMTFEVRTSIEPLRIVTAVREAARVIDPDVVLMNVQTQRQQIAGTIRTERLVAAVTSLFSAIALLLASVGLYGIVAYDVRRRTGEIGIRTALGATRVHVLRLVLRETATTVAAGTLLGVVLALATGRLVERMLFGVVPSDPTTMSAAVLVLVAVSAAAAYLPARRATRVDPAQALRCE